MYYLGIDIGTTNIKALVINDSGEVLSRASMPVELIKTPDGGVEQDLSQIYSALCTAVRNATSDCADKIKAVGVSSQGGALQLFDENRNPLGNVISWMDERGGAYDEKLTAEFGREFFLEHIGYHKSGICAGQLMRLAENGELQHASGIGFVGDSIAEKLCGVPAHDGTSFAITFLYNPWNDCADDEILSRISANEKQFPKLMQANDIAGYMGQQAAADMNLPVGIPVSPAVHDQYAASLAAGAVKAGDVCIGTGTAWVLTVTTAGLLAPLIEGAYVCNHPAGGGGQLISLCTGGGAITLVMQKIGESKFTSQRVDELINSTPAGCDGLKCVELTNTQIGFTGENSLHTPGHYVRAVVESLAGKLRDSLQQFSAGNLPVNRLIMCGKAATSEPVSQLVADVTKLPVLCLEESDVSTYGAAIIAASIGKDKGELLMNAKKLSLTGTIRQPL